MFGKLMKYEMKSLSKGLIPLYGAVLAMALINSILFRVGGITFGEQDNSIVQMTTILLYASLCIAIAVMTLVVVIQRFYKGLLGQEGYLMFTLPVPTWHLTLSKLLGATLMTILSAIVGVTSVFVFGSFGLHLESIFQMADIIVFNISGNSVLRSAEVILSGIISLASEIAQVYLAMALGHLANKHRIGWSIGAYLAITTVLASINSFILVGTSQDRGLLMTVGGSIISGAHSVMWFTIIADLILTAVFYAATTYILQKKLNLE